MTTVSEHKTIKALGATDNAFSFGHVKDITSLNSALATFLKKEATHNVYTRKWDFDGSSVIDDFWTLYTDATATAFTAASPQVNGGALAGATGATDNGGLAMLGTACIKGDKRGGMHAHFKLSAVTGVQLEVGLIDAVSDGTLPVITDVDTPASGNGGADIAVVHMDTDQTLTTMAFVVDGSTSGMSCTKENIGTLTPTADTYMCVKIQLDGDDVVCIVDNKRSQRKVHLANVEGGTLLRPWLYFRTRNTTSKTVSVDMVEIWTERD